MVVQNVAARLVHCKLSRRRWAKYSECLCTAQAICMVSGIKKSRRLKPGQVCSGDLVRLDHPDVGLLLLM